MEVLGKKGQSSCRNSAVPCELARHIIVLHVPSKVDRSIDSSHNYLYRTKHSKGMNSSKMIDDNNTAVAFLRQGKHKQATDLLRTVIADLKNHFVAHNQSVGFSESSFAMESDASSSSSSASFNDNDNFPFIDVDQQQCKRSVLSVPLWSDESVARKNDESLIFLYAQAFVLANIDHRREVLIGVVLYNMALAKHARAIETNRSSLLMVALKMYGMAVAVVKGQTDLGVKSSSYLLLLALYNNMAQISLSCAAAEKLRQCLRNIEALLHVDRIEQVIDEEDYAFFATNAMLQLSVAASPAA
jgi:hypothetical protein